MLCVTCNTRQSTKLEAPLDAAIMVRGTQYPAPPRFTATVALPILRFSSISTMIQLVRGCCSSVTLGLCTVCCFTQRGAHALRADYLVTYTLYHAYAESKPLDPKENAQVLEKIDAMRLKTLASVNSTLHSITDYSSANPLES